MPYFLFVSKINIYLVLLLGDGNVDYRLNKLLYSTG